MGHRYIPQEVLNDDFRALDRADMFMLGASLYELATGTHLPSGAPFSSSPKGPADPRTWQLPILA